MKKFKVEGWFRYSNADEKDYEVETIEASNAEVAISLFKSIWASTLFFRIYVKEI
jgi:hypothetical protein